MAEYKPRKQGVDNYHQQVKGKGLNTSTGKRTFEPGYVEVPGKGTRYRNAQGEYFQNHFGSIFNSFRKAKDGVGDAYNNYYDGVADKVGTERRDGTKATPAYTPRPVRGPLKDKKPGDPQTKVGPVDQKPAAPAQPAVESKDSRVNANGLVSYGKDLSSLNKFTSAFTGGYELTDIKSAFQSNDLAGAYQNGSNKLSYQDTPYELDSSAKPSNVGGKYTMDGVDTSIQNTGYQLDGKSVPGTVGGNPNDPQDGTSSKPDVAEQVRQVRMRRKGPRDEGSFRGFNIDRNNAIAQQPQAEAPDPEKIAQQQRRNKIRSAFMDLDTPIIKASVAANAEASYGKDSNGNARFNYGGELVYAKEGMEQQAKNAAMMGRNPSEFLDIKIKEVQDKEKDK